MVSLTCWAIISDSDLEIKSDAVPENKTGVAKTVSALREAMGLARWRLDIPMLRTCPRDLL